MTPKNILIVRTDRIGDVVLTLPLAAVLKELYPGARVTFLVNDYTRPVVAACSAVDEVLVPPAIDGKTDVSRLIAMLRGKKFDTAFVVYPRPETAWACFRAGIPVRVGTAFRWYSFLFNRKIRDHRKDVAHHELEYNIRMLAGIGAEYHMTPAVVEYGLQSDSALSAAAEKMLAENSISPARTIVVVHPGSGGSAMDLPRESFVKLVAILAREFQVVVTGSPQESELCAAVCNGTAAVNLAGKLNLEQLMGIIGKSDIFVSNSTGPLHIAAALGRHVIGFYPKIKVCSPERWAPYTAKRAVFVPPIKCTDCSREQCARLQCMSSIDVLQIVEQIKQFSTLVLKDGVDNE